MFTTAAVSPGSLRLDAKRLLNEAQLRVADAIERNAPQEVIDEALSAAFVAAQAVALVLGTAPPQPDQYFRNPSPKRRRRLPRPVPAGPPRVANLPPPKRGEDLIPRIDHDADAGFGRQVFPEQRLERLAAPRKPAPPPSPPKPVSIKLDEATITKKFELLFAPPKAPPAPLPPLVKPSNLPQDKAAVAARLKRLEEWSQPMSIPAPPALPENPNTIKLTNAQRIEWVDRFYSQRPAEINERQQAAVNKVIAAEWHAPVRTAEQVSAHYAKLQTVHTFASASALGLDTSATHTPHTSSAGGAAGVADALGASAAARVLDDAGVPTRDRRASVPKASHASSAKGPLPQLRAAPRSDASPPPAGAPAAGAPAAAVPASVIVTPDDATAEVSDVGSYGGLKVPSFRVSNNGNKDGSHNPPRGPVSPSSDAGAGVARPIGGSGALQLGDLLVGTPGDIARRSDGGLLSDP